MEAEKSRRAAVLLTEAARASSQRDYARACALLEEAARLYRDLAQSDQGHPDESVTQREPRAASERRLKAWRGYGAALYQLTIASLLAERPHDALQAAQHGYEVIARYGIRPALQLVKLRALRALALLDLNRPQEAFQEIEGAFGDLLAEKDPIVRAEAATRLTWIKGLVLFALGQYEDALQHLDRAYIHFQNQGQHQFWHVVGMAEALMAVGRRDDALEFYRVGVEILKKREALVPFREFRVGMISSL